MRPHPLDRVFAPRALVVLGAEGDDSVGGRVLRNVLAGGFAGAVHAIHPRHEAIAGVRCQRSLEAIPGPVDLAVVATPLADAAGAVAALGARGVAAAILPLRVPPASRRDGSAAVAERALLAEAARHGVRLIGPNSVGLIRPASRLHATFGRVGARPGSVALVSQSAAICATMLDWAEAHRIGFSAVTSLGDAVDVDAGEILEYLALDDQTRSILIYLERIRSARALLSGLRVAARAKPVVVVKAGRHAREEDGAGRPAASDDAFDAALARAGAVRVLSIDQMFAAAQLLETGRRVAGNRLAIVTNARGPGVLAADRALDLGLGVPRLGEATRAALAERLSEVGEPGNPLDLLGDAGPVRYQAALESCLADPGVDGVVAMLAPQPLARPVESAEAVIELARSSTKPVLACWMGEEAVRPARSRFAEAGVPEFASPERAVEAFGLLTSYHRNQRLLRLVPGPIAAKDRPHTDLAREVVAAALARGRGWLTTEEVRRLLSAIGIRPEAPLRAQARGTELHVEVARDPVFGPVIRFGLGVGPAAAGERIVALPPLNTALVETLIQTSPVAGAFGEAGGIPEAEREALERSLWALSEIICEIPEITELQLHPIVARGSVAWAAGARVAVAPADPSAGRYGHMAIHPYPTDVGARWKLADGAVVTVRPIRPEDAEMEASFVRNLSLDSRHLRFMVGLSQLPPEVLFRFTQIDYDRELALLAVVEREGEEVEIAVARYMTAGDGRSADVAIVVADEWQGRGIGVRLFGLLIDYARARGLQRLVGETLAENSAAIALVTRLGFTTRRDPDDPGMVLLEKVLA